MTTDEHVHPLVTHFAKEQFGEHVVVTHWMVVAEVVDADANDTYLLTAHRKGMQLWQQAGLIEGARMRLYGERAAGAIADTEED